MIQAADISLPLLTVEEPQASPRGEVPEGRRGGS